MGKQVTWAEHVARLEQEIKNHPDSEGFRHSQVTKTSGDVVTFRPISDLRAELNLARIEASRERQSGGFSWEMHEVAL